MPDNKPQPAFCKFLANGIHFTPDKIRCCCANKHGPLLAKDYKGQKINWDEITQKREDILKEFAEGNIPEECKGCFQLNVPEVITPDENTKVGNINQLYISHWLHCNCGCIYCTNRFITNSRADKKVRKSEFYDAYPIIKDMIDQNILERETIVTFLGGESTVLKEFDKLLDILGKHVEYPLNVLSSGIKFNRKLYNLMKKDKIFLMVSIDTGNRETYKRLKQVDEFKNVVKNLKKYASASKNAPKMITSKLILVEGINDNIEEIENWLKLTQQMNINRVRMDIEYSNHYIKTRKFPPHFLEIFKFIQEKTKELNLTLESYEQVTQYLEAGEIY